MNHIRPKPEWARRGRFCPCGNPETHYGMSGDPRIPDGMSGGPVALTMGCELCMRRWVRGGPNPGRYPVNGF